MAKPLPDRDWRLRRFDEMAQIVNDRVDDPSKSDVEHYVGLEHLDSDSLVIRRWGLPTDVDASKLLFRAGDIIFGRRRVYQRKVAVANFDGICSAHAMVLRARTDVVLDEFLPFFMQSDRFMDRARQISVGSLSPTINWKTLAKEEFALPPLESQRRIAEALSQISRVGEALEQAHRAVSQLLAALTMDMSRVASGFRTLEDVVECVEAGVSLAAHNSPAGPGECGVLKVSAVGDWHFYPGENKRIDPAAFVPAAKVSTGDFLATRANADPDAVGRTCIVRGVIPDGLMLSDKTWRIKLAGPFSALGPGVCAWTKSAIFRRHVLGHVGGTDAQNISQQRFLAGPFPNVSMDILCRFSNQVEAALAVQSSFRVRREEAGRLAKALWEGGAA